MSKAEKMITIEIMVRNKENEKMRMERYLRQFERKGGRGQNPDHPACQTERVSS